MLGQRRLGPGERVEVGQRLTARAAAHRTADRDRLGRAVVEPRGNIDIKRRFARSGIGGGCPVF